jgi:hypothetical protein
MHTNVFKKKQHHLAGGIKLFHLSGGGVGFFGFLGFSSISSSGTKVWNLSGGNIPDEFLGSV